MAYIGRKSRTERPRKTKIGTGVAHVTRDSDTTFKVKDQGHQAALLTTALTHEAGAASGDRENVLGVGNYCYVASARRLARCPQRRRGAGTYRVAMNTACYPGSYLMLSMCLWWQYLRLVRGFKYYGYIVFKPCTSDYPQPDTHVTVATGNKELNFRIHRKVCICNVSKYI